MSSTASVWPASRAQWPEWLQRARSFSATLWRGVEAQHKVATLKVVDTLAEHERLEELLEQSKPPLPREASALHCLLATPFRYTSARPSRFRAAHEPGVWYGARALRSACAETGYWRWRFAADSGALRNEQVVSELTFFQVQVRGRAADLVAPPWSAFETAWMNPSDCTATHALSRAARDAELHWIHYRSVCDPQHGACGAVLRAPALRMGDLTRQHTWVCRVRREAVVMQPTALDATERPFEFAFR